MKRKATQIVKDFRKENVIYKKAIRAHCFECMCESKLDCLIPDCPLYPFRPNRK